MAKANTKAVFDCDVEKIWSIVTSPENCSWRSDLERTESTGNGQFIEYSKDGFATVFTVTANEFCRRWEFDLENDNIKGHWSGIFAKKFFIKPFVKSYLKKQQALYFKDLQKALL